MVRLLIADPDSATAEFVASVAPDDAQLVRATECVRARSLASRQAFDVAVVDLDLPGGDPLELVRSLTDATPPTHSIVVSAFGGVDDAVASMRAGAGDFVCKPFSTDQLRLTLVRELERARLRTENHTLRRQLDDRLSLQHLSAGDPAMQSVLKTVHAVADARTTVLITGESGTGKTMLARAIHRASNRADQPFVEVNCGALPESLLESELFGHVRGAFTGAVSDRAGKFESAEGGTIFLDEIGTASPSLQVKLLRVLQDRKIERVGSTETIDVDVRIVLATNVDLAAEVRAGRFREDLFYRIHVVTLDVPPLRARPGDVVHLAERFLHRFARELGKDVREFTDSAKRLLIDHDWPGNVRQLENVVERAALLAPGPRVEIEHLSIGGDPLQPTVDSPTPQTALDADAHLRPLKEALIGPEREIIRRALVHFGGHRQEAAASLGVSRSTLFNKMRKYGLLDTRSDDFGR